ncbi:hypothetical protein OS493_010948 [Desmophyllum pertusum]|uniref:ferroxidase n=1 Tax=Desmophyllum pertusum TaxID=174260 RepID=A0A9X0CZL0_9CNID|nr:hypothetical protein OS493_010948 [Desmophyllum pertusum]
MARRIVLNPGPRCQCLWNAWRVSTFDGNVSVMLAIRRICLLKKFEVKSFAFCSIILNNRSFISAATKRSHHLLISTRLKLYQRGIPLTEKFCTASTLDELSFHNIADETLDAVAELFEDLGETPSSPTDYDVYLSDGVLTVNLGAGRGTYVINKQSPNKQIWLSSPTSGPKRYDFKNGSWIYTHDGVCLHSLLSSEISVALGHDVDFTLLSYGGADEKLS